MNKEQYNNLKVIQLFDPDTVTSDQASIPSVDTQGYGSLTFLALIGASGDTLSGTVYIELELEESDDDSNFTDCANVDVEGAVTGTNTGTFGVINDPAEDDAAYKGGYKGGKRYVRPVINVTGTHSNGTPIGIVALLGDAKYPPVA